MISFFCLFLLDNIIMRWCLTLNHAKPLNRFNWHFWLESILVNLSGTRIEKFRNWPITESLTSFGSNDRKPAEFGSRAIWFREMGAGLFNPQFKKSSRFSSSTVQYGYDGWVQFDYDIYVMVQFKLDSNDCESAR